MNNRYIQFLTKAKVFDPIADYYPKVSMTTLLLILLMVSKTMNAQYARAYSNMPTSSNLFEFTALTTSSNTFVNEDIPTAMTSRINTGVFTFVRTMPGLKQRAAGIGFVLPVSNLLTYSKTTNGVLADQTGIADPSFTLDHNIFGGKAMKVDEF